MEHKPSGVQTVNGVAPDAKGDVVVEVPSQVQSDLSVNDESDPAFVKGVIRPESLPYGYPFEIELDRWILFDIEPTNWREHQGYSVDVIQPDSMFIPFEGKYNDNVLVELDGDYGKKIGRTIITTDGSFSISGLGAYGIITVDSHSETETYGIWVNGAKPKTIKVYIADFNVSPLNERYIPKLSYIILKSSNSSKKFKITVDDSGALTSTEITE